MRLEWEIIGTASKKWEDDDRTKQHNGICMGINGMDVGMCMGFYGDVMGLHGDLLGF